MTVSAANSNQPPTAGRQPTRCTIETEHIRLAQLLKLVNAVHDGVEAKLVISEGLVTMNGTVETRRGRKIRDGDRICYAGREYLVARREKEQP